MQTVRCKNCNKKLAEINKETIDQSLAKNNPDSEILAIKCRYCKIIHIVKASELLEKRRQETPVLREVINGKSLSHR